MEDMRKLINRADKLRDKIEKDQLKLKKIENKIYSNTFGEQKLNTYGAVDFKSFEVNKLSSLIELVNDTSPIISIDTEWDNWTVYEAESGALYHNDCATDGLSFSVLPVCWNGGEFLIGRINSGKVFWDAPTKIEDQDSDEVEFLRDTQEAMKLFLLNKEADAAIANEILNDETIPITDLK